jgi:site-specific recombinase XerD
VRIIQPYLDHIALSAFEHYWDEQAMVFYNHNTDRTLTKQRFGKIFTDAWHKAATPAKINPLKTKRLCFI